ncbi:glutamine--fructose-6-phosphate transaminase (isomerizing) [Candidatus Woesearchaeota archaeon CG10_big_fil_rev_8_21_14_0_10_36_11]|nr:MAG: glutamine--fructose-6-phosphate transaminase (isomerizing) [Candidatus Woesearchaeota archaeon CG10_big_fil_rev_8_21_14_0_10_36_11]
MCGIIGYVGEKEANDILIAGLERLEYRGYDSAGIAVTHNNTISINKSEGRVHNLKKEKLDGTIGIGHTRWATHGPPSNKNAHPFTCNEKKFVVVHNGIIENYLELKSGLHRSGISCTSDTDSEVIVHLIAQAYGGNLKEAVCKVIKHLQGSYALCVMHKDTHELVGARNGSPLLIGIGKGENFFASDASAIIDYTKDVIYMNDFQIAEIGKNLVTVFDFDGVEQSHEIKKIDWNLEQAQKSGYKHFMLKEIFEQPSVAQESLKVTFAIRKDFSRIIFVACGTASYAGLVGKYIIEKIAKIPVVNEIASEFRYKECLISEKDLVIAISQSGETADTLAAVRLARQKGARTLGLINVVDSTIAREVDSVVYTRAGPEIGVASTKAFISQLVMLYKFAFHLTENGMSNDIVDKIKETLKLSESIRKLAEQYYTCQNFLYIGRNIHFPLALEGALKLKEISYIHAEAYPAGELKHGPIALVCTEMPTIAICPQDSVYEKTYSNIEEIKARNGKVITIATEGDERIRNVSNDIIYVPKVDDIFYPFVIAVVLQLFAYHIADLRDCDVDKPRNLAKSVTVE